MHRIRSILVIGVALSVAGCAIHPLPKDVTRQATYSIVNKIRCEARAALTASLVEQLSEDDFAGGHNRDIVSKLLDPRYDVSAFVKDYNDNPSIVDGESQKRINIYRVSTIGYRFAFEITEDNDNVVNLKLADNSILKGMFNLSIQGGDQRKRKNKREFSFTDNFEKLLSFGGLCTSTELRSTDKNWVYPITGRVGLDEVIETFLRLSFAQEIAFGGETKGFVDTLTFTTIYYGTVAPKLTLSPITDAFHPTEVSADKLKATRTDMHELAVTVVLPKSKEDTSETTADTALKTLDRAEFLGILEERLDR